MRWRMLGWICLAELGALSLWFSATAVIPALRTTWMSTHAQAWLSMAVTLGFVVGTIVSAALTLADFAGARRLFVLTAIGGAVVNAALLIVIESLPLVLVARFLTGLAMAGTYPPAMKLAASWFAADRGLAVGSLVGALTLGGALPHLINFAGGLAWAPVIAGTSLAALGASIVMATLVRDGPHVQARAPFSPGCVRELVRSRGVVLASLGYFGHMWELYAMWTWIGLYLLEAFTRAGVPAAPRLGAIATAVVIGAGAASCVLAGFMADRIGRTAVTMLSGSRSAGRGGSSWSPSCGASPSSPTRLSSRRRSPSSRHRRTLGRRCRSRQAWGSCSRSSPRGSCRGPSRPGTGRGPSRSWPPGLSWARWQWHCSAGCPRARGSLRAAGSTGGPGGIFYNRGLPGHVRHPGRRDPSQGAAQGLDHAHGRPAGRESPPRPQL